MTTAAAAVAPITTSRVGQVMLDQLRPHPRNPRRVTPTDPKVQELAKTLQQVGQITPLVVRERDERFTYEILAGHRRFTAAQIAGLDSLECRVVVADDRQALDIVVIENLQREDLSPIEEAAGIAALLEAGEDVAHVAARLGRPPQWVARRAKLHEIVPAWKDACADPKHFASRLSAGHLELIARLQPVQQEKLLKDHAWAWRLGGQQAPPCSVKDLDDVITRELLLELKEAPWPLVDAALVIDAGACATCPKRSSAQALLFDTDETKAKRSDRCLDRTCWEAKAAAWGRQQAEKAREKHPDLVVLKERDLQQVVKADKGERGARPALNPQTGKVQYVKPQSWADATTKKAFGVAEPDGKPAAKPGRPTKDAVAQQELAAKRRKHVVAAIQAALEKRPMPSTALLLRLSCFAWLDAESPSEAAVWRRIDPAVVADSAIAKAVWSNVLERIGEGLNDFVTAGLRVKGAYLGIDRDALDRIAGLADVELSDLEAAATKAHPDPEQALAPAKGAKPAKPLPPAKAPPPKRAKAKAGKAKGAKGKA